MSRTAPKSAASGPFQAAAYLRPADLPGFLFEALHDGDLRALPVALRTAADVLGGVAKLAETTGLSRETLYRTLSECGKPMLDTLAKILDAFGMQLTVAAKPARAKRSATKSPANAAKRKAA
jgi:probable addiction module antidote protein